MCGFNRADELNPATITKNAIPDAKKPWKSTYGTYFNLKKNLRATIHIAIPAQIPCRTLRRDSSNAMCKLPKPARGQGPVAHVIPLIGGIQMWGRMRRPIRSLYPAVAIASPSPAVEGSGPKGLQIRQGNSAYKGPVAAPSIEGRPFTHNYLCTPDHLVLFL